MKVYTFIQGAKGDPRFAPFKMVVFAESPRAAKTYVANQAISSIAHRGLVFAGEGEPLDPCGWTCARVQGPVSP